MVECLMQLMALDSMGQHGDEYAGGPRNPKYLNTPKLPEPPYNLRSGSGASGNSGSGDGSAGGSGGVSGAGSRTGSKLRGGGGGTAGSGTGGNQGGGSLAASVFSKGGMFAAKALQLGELSVIRGANAV